MDSCQEIQALAQLVVKIDGNAVVEECINKVVVAASFITGKMSIDEPNRVEEILWMLGQTAGEFDLA